MKTGQPTRTLASGRDMLPAGTVLAGRYRIQEVSGVGGMGVVYRARDLQLDVDVALKILQADGPVDGAALERFRREVLLSRRVSHPNVVRLHDIGQDGDTLFLTMDFVAAHTLRERLADGPLPVGDAVAVARALADALAAAHREGVVHRDLKPANVLLDDGQRARLTDFGIARSLGDVGVTRAGEFIGTLDYLAPEQVRGDPVDGRADIYALGLVLWEMLTGAVPMRGETREETLAQRAAGRLPAALPRADRVPRRIQAIVRRCLAPAPAQRYADASELAADLARGSARLDAARWARRTAVAAVVVAAAALAWTAWPPQRAAAPVSAERVAVLPLVNATGDAAHDWIQRALAENLSLALAASPAVQAVESVRVFSSLDDLRLVPARIDGRGLRELVELFNAGTVVRGQLIGGEDGLRLQLRLFRRGSADEVPFETSVTPATLLDGAERLAAEVLRELRLPRAPPGEARLSAVPAALVAFDEGVAQLVRGDRPAAIAALEDAVAADPEFGVAWLRLADAYGDAGFYNRAVDAAAKARALLDDAGGRYAMWARARHAALSGDAAQALAGFARLVDVYPQDVDARVAYGELLGDAGRFDEAMALLRGVTEVDPQHPRAWFLLGKLGIMSGEVRAAADDWLVRALVVQNRIGTDGGRGDVLNALGIANQQLGELEIAAAHYREAARLRGAAGDVRGEAGSLANLARLIMIDGDIERARATLERALVLREGIGDLPGVADLRNEFGVIDEEAGDYAAALEHYREALRLRTEVGDTRAVAESYVNVAFAYLMRGDYENAAAYADRALAAHGDGGNLDGRMAALLTIGQIGVARGDWDRARAAVLEALELSRQLGNPFGEAAAEGVIARMSRLQGLPAAALAAYERALEIVAPLGDTRGLAEFHLGRAETLLDLGLRDEAARDITRVAEWLGERGNLGQRALLAQLQGTFAALDGDAGTADALFAEAERFAAASGSRAALLAVQSARTRALPAEVHDVTRLAAEAARLGNRPLRLEVMARLAEVQLLAGDAEAAHATVREALRPPAALAAWAGNWRLHWLRAQTERATGRGDGAAAAALAEEMFKARWAGLPEMLGTGTAQMPEMEPTYAVAH